MMHLAFSWIPFFLLSVLWMNLIKKIKWKKRSSNEASKLPPGPRKLPIIGNMHQLMGSLPHHALKSLAQKHGDLMHLQLGEISAIVASSPRTAKEILKTHDLAFAQRPELLVGKVVFYNYSDIAFSPYGDYWRQMRKICTSELLSNKRVRSFCSIRRDEVLKLLSSIREESLSQSKQGINLAHKVSLYTSSMVCRATVGRTCGQYGDELVELIFEVVYRGSGFDVSDIFPSWKILHHLSSMKPQLVELHKKIDEILETIIKEHVENPIGMTNGESGPEDLVDVLLRIKRTGDLRFPITNTNIKAVILDMFTGGIETSSSVVEWAMAEMMKNPNVLAKAQNEVREVLFTEKEIIEESDLQKLRYLKLVIKETMRLHPPAPLLVPRNSWEQCEIDGYIISPQTRIIVNAWAIGRDPKHWNEPESFIPERFDNYEDFTSIDDGYIPFGAGRRSCPGMSFGLANVEVPLANLLYYCDWKLPNNITSTSLDMSETYGLTANRKNNLILIASMNESLHKH